MNSQLSIADADADADLPDDHACLQRFIGVPTTMVCGGDNHEHVEFDLEAALAETQALSRKLTDAQSQLLQSGKMAAIGQLAAGVAHDVNSLIGFITSNLNTLDSYLKDIFAVVAAYEAAERGSCADCAHLDATRTLVREKEIDYLRSDSVQLMDESRDGLTRVSRIVRDLKNFSRPDESTLQWADLHQGLDSTLNIVRNEIKDKCAVKKEYGELPLVWCSPFQINQVFMNLLVNAAHAISEKGEITIRTGRQGNRVFVAVSDTGTGVAPEHISRIFEPFFTTKPVDKGTGLGLSVAYGIVQKHQGRIEARSEIGKGTTFTVWLPIVAENAGASPSG